MRIKKVKVTKDEKISIEYEVKRKDGNYDEFTMLSGDKPMGSFHSAMQALGEDVIEMCELPQGDRERLMVKGVSFSYGGENEVMGVVISAAKNLLTANCPLNLVTPHKTEEHYNEAGGDDKQLLSEDCVKRLYSVINETEQFIQGVRAQMKMFDVA